MRAPKLKVYVSAAALHDMPKLYVGYHVKTQNPAEAGCYVDFLWKRTLSGIHRTSIAHCRANANL